MTTPLVTLDEVRAYMAIRSDVSMPDVDSRINGQIYLATQQIETALSCEFTKQERTEYFNTGRNGRFVYDFSGGGINECGVRSDPVPQSFLLKAFPIDTTADFGVYYDATPEALFDPVTSQVTAYRLDAERGKITCRASFVNAEQSLKVVYTGGYAVDTATGTLTTSAPADLKMACILQSIYLFVRLQPDNIGMQQDRGAGKVGNATFMTRGGITPEAATLLWRYKRLAGGRY